MASKKEQLDRARELVCQDKGGHFTFNIEMQDNVPRAITCNDCKRTWIVCEEAR